MSAVPFSSIAHAMAAQAKASLAKERASREVGTEGVMLGLTDYRRPPETQIHSADWAVWKVRWDGREWVRVKRLAAHKTFDEVLVSAGRWADELGLKRVD